MAIEITETHELVRTIERLAPVTSYWLDLCFPSVHLSQTEYIDFDLVDHARRLAPFVAPTVQGQPMVHRGHSIRKFKPAYIKPKDPVDPARLLTRSAGELFSAGNQTLAQREDAIVADILNQQRTGIMRRWEWMACRAVADGSIIIEGENYPRVSLSFGRDAGNTKTLTLGARWSETTSTPLEDLEDWMLEVFQRSGYPVKRITFTPSAWKNFVGHASTQNMLETRRGSENMIETGPSNAAEPAQYRGTLKSAAVDLWVYNDFYEDNQGTQVPFLEDGDIVLTAASVDGIRAFGAIMDKKANYESLPIFPKMWEQEDPSGLFIMSQSAPLMIPARPNASMKVSVNG
jgi:hypothetical protein